MTLFERSLEKFERLGELYDFYGVLLTLKENLLIEKFLYEGLSISEIAREIGCSRQGVYDMLHRIEKKLQNFEEKMGLARKEKMLLELFSKFKNRMPEELRQEIEELIFSPGGDQAGS